MQVEKMRSRTFFPAAPACRLDTTHVANQPHAHLRGLLPAPVAFSHLKNLFAGVLAPYAALSQPLGFIRFSRAAEISKVKNGFSQVKFHFSHMKKSFAQMKFHFSHVKKSFAQMKNRAPRRCRLGTGSSAGAPISACSLL